jgi:hypothetical protein
MELAQDRVQWRALVLAMLNLRVLPPYMVLVILGYAGVWVKTMTQISPSAFK